MAAALSTGQGPDLGQGLVLQNECLRVEIDPKTGAFADVENRKTGQVLLRAGANDRIAPPFRLRFLGQPGTPEAASQGAVSASLFHAEPLGAEKSGFRLVWEADRGARVEAELSLPSGDAPLEIRAMVLNEGKEALESLEYPILRGLQPVGADPSKTFLAAPYKEGCVFRDPFQALDTLGPGRSNLFSFLYPRGHNLTMQFFTLYEEGRGGFYLAAHDGRQTVKNFNFGLEGGSRFFALTQMNWDCRPGQGMALDYPFIVAPMTEGSWQEAADRYKTWALAQDWAKRPVSERRKSIGWLFDRAGFSVFGISAWEDQRPWYEAFHAIARRGDAEALFVASGAWRDLWGAEGAPASAPADSHFRDNMEVVRKNGDAIVPFYFDLRTRTDVPSWTRRVAGDPGSPWNVHAIQAGPLAGSKEEEAEAEFGGAGTAFLCPTEQAFVDLHGARDERLAERGGMDGAYYDISINLGPVSCFDPRHAHPPGWGRWMFDAYRRLFDESRRAATQARGKPIVLGTEQITEGTLGAVDFYHLGAAGLGPIRRPGSRFDAMIMDGRSRQIPLFEYVYHGFGPVRTGGKIQISTDFGDAWFFIAGQEYLWGGLIELIYFNTPLELFPGTKPPTLKTGFRPGGAQWEDNPRLADPKKMAFLAECAALRTGAGRDYLAGGTMLRQPPAEGAGQTLNLDFWHYADIKGPKFSRKGTFPCPELLREAWRAPDGRLGLFFVNLHGDKPLEISLSRRTLEALYGVPAGSRLEARSSADSPPAEVRETGDGWRIALPPRHPVLIEIVMKTARR